MNRWLMIRRLRGPAFVILIGITALLNQWDILSFSQSWPLYLILLGLLRLAERAALAAASMPPPQQFWTPAATAPRGPMQTGLVPVHPVEGTGATGPQSGNGGA